MQHDIRPLAGKVALVTGASRGVGKAVALRFAEAGAAVTVTARSVTTRSDVPGTVGETTKAIEAAGGRALGVAADLSRLADIERVVRETLAAFGRIDVVVNSAAYMEEGLYETFWQMTPDTWRQQMELNAIGPFYLVKAVAIGMRQQGGGRIILISSSSGNTNANPLAAPIPGKGGTGVGYASSKAALNRMTNALATELKEAHISITALSPGFTLTENAPRMGAKYGFDTKFAHSTAVPASAALYLATCADPMPYSGRYVESRDLVAQHQLIPL